MINNLQTQRQISDEEWERRYAKAFQRKTLKPDFETLRKIGDCTYWIKTHPELDEHEVCEKYGLDFNIYQQYKGETE